MMIRKTQISDMSEVMAIFDEARETIAALGIDQWQNGYPNREVILEDIEKGRSYTVYDGKVLGTFAIILDSEPTYDKILDGHWLTGDNYQDYMAIHRVAISVASRGKGISTQIINFAQDLAKANNRSSLRIDTHEGNVVMRRMLEKHGFVYCGIIFLESGESRVAYEKII